MPTTLITPSIQLGYFPNIAKLEQDRKDQLGPAQAEDSTKPDQRQEVFHREKVFINGLFKRILPIVLQSIDEFVDSRPWEFDDLNKLNLYRQQYDADIGLGKLKINGKIYRILFNSIDANGSNPWNWRSHAKDLNFSIKPDGDEKTNFEFKSSGPLDQPRNVQLDYLSMKSPQGQLIYRKSLSLDDDVTKQYRGKFRPQQECISLVNSEIAGSYLNTHHYLKA